MKIEDYELDDTDEINYHNETNGNKQYMFNNKIKTSLDYIKFQSEEYIKYKFDEKVRDRIKELNLGSKYFNEICEIAFYYYNINKNNSENKMKVSDIISIVTYKIIKKYNLFMTNQEIYQKINLNKRKYLKYSKYILVDIQEEKSERDYLNKLNDFYNSLCSRLKEFSFLNPHAFKFKPSLDVFELNCDINNTNFYGDIQNSFDIVKRKGKEIINRIDFYGFLSEKIGMEILAAGLLKELMKNLGVIITLKIFEKEFNINSSSITNAIKIIKQFLNK